MKYVKTTRLVKKGTWIVLSWRDGDGENILAGRIKMIRNSDYAVLAGDGIRKSRYYTFQKRGFMANVVIKEAMERDEEELYDDWGMYYQIGYSREAEMLAVCEDEKDMNDAYFAAVL